MHRIRAAALAAVWALAGCAHREESRATPPATHVPSPPAAASRTPITSHTVHETPGATRTAIMPAPVQPRHAAVAPPRILSVSVSPTSVHSGSVVGAAVSTTPGVVTVTAYAAGQAVGVPRVGVGRFAGSTTLPALPPFVHGAFPVTFRAQDARGATTQTALSVTVP